MKGAVPLQKCPHGPPVCSYFAIFGNLFGFKNFGKLVAADNIVNSLFGLLQVTACVGYSLRTPVWGLLQRKRQCVSFTSFLWIFLWLCPAQAQFTTFGVPGMTVLEPAQAMPSLPSQNILLFVHAVPAGVCGPAQQLHLDQHFASHRPAAFIHLRILHVPLGECRPRTDPVGLQAVMHAKLVALPRMFCNHFLLHRLQPSLIWPASHWPLAWFCVQTTRGRGARDATLLSENGGCANAAVLPGLSLSVKMFSFEAVDTSCAGRLE